MAEIVPAEPISRLPESFQRRARQIAERVVEIDALLVPASPEQIGDELKRMRRQLRPQPDTETGEMASGFRDACRDLPAWAISEAANDYLAGRVENHTGQFMPACAEFAKRARTILIPFLSERHSLRTEAEKLVERATDEARRHKIAMERQDPKRSARIAALMAGAFPQETKLPSATHTGLSAENQDRLDVLKKRPGDFVSLIPQTRIGGGKRQEQSK